MREKERERERVREREREGREGGEREEERGEGGARRQEVRGITITEKSTNNTMLESYGDSYCVEVCGNICKHAI